MSTSDRLAQTLSLLRSRDLYDAPTMTTTGRMILTNTKAEAGEGNEEWIDCPDCSGHDRPGWRKLRRVWQPCERCGGHWHDGIAIGGRGTRLVDSYTGRELGSEQTEVRSAAPLRRVPCDACRPLGWTEERSSGYVLGERCELCSGSGWAPAFAQRMRPWRSGSDNAMLRDLVRGLRDPLLRAIVTRSALGSYDELSLAMAQLRVADYAGYRATAALEHDHRSPKEIRYDLAAWFGLLFVERRMPAVIRVPPDVVAIERREAFERRKKDRREEEAA